MAGNNLKRRRGEHGPLRKRRNIILALAERVGTPRAAVLDEARRLNRQAFAQMAAEERELWTRRAYQFYFYFLENGVEAASRGRRRLTSNVPEEIINLPVARRRFLQPFEVATWAFQVRQKRMGWEDVLNKLDREGRKQWVKSDGRMQDIQARLQDLQRKRPQDMQEIDYQSALLAFVKAFVQGSEAAAPTSDSIRKAVQRNRLIWELAEKKFFT